jgi:hypothetical protein
MNISDPPHQSPKGFGARHKQALLLFVSLSIGFTMRAHLSVSLVAMTNPFIFQTMDETATNLTIGVNNSDTVVQNTTSDVIEDELSNWNVYRVSIFKQNRNQVIDTFTYCPFT